MAYTMKAELHLMTYVRMIGLSVDVDPDREGLELSMQRFFMITKSDWVFMSWLVDPGNSG